MFHYRDVWGYSVAAVQKPADRWGFGMMFLLVLLSPEALGCPSLLFFVVFCSLCWFFLSSGVTETASTIPIQVGRAFSDMRNADQLDEWITSARARLAAGEVVSLRSSGVSALALAFPPFGSASLP
jgi:hypothetical protein